MSRKQFVLGTAFILVVALMGVPGARTSEAGATTFTISYTYPVFPAEIWVDCANDGQGETVTFSGLLHETVHESIDANGGYHFTIETNPIGVVGVGEDSGDTFRGVGCTRTSLHIAPDSMPFTYNLESHFGAIGTGHAPNLTIREVSRFTIDANGIFRTGAEFTVETCD